MEEKARKGLKYYPKFCYLIESFKALSGFHFRIDFQLKISGRFMKRFCFGV